VLVTADQRLEPLIGSELDVQAPRVPEHHHEGLGAAPPLGEGEPGGGPVDLGLTARSRLEPHRGLCQDPLGLAQRPYSTLHRLIAAGVPLRVELLKQPHGIIVQLRRPHAQVRLVRRQQPHPGGPV